MPVVVLAGLVLAQVIQAQPADGPDLARIRKALAEPPPVVTVSPPDRPSGPVFRVTVRSAKPEPPLWANWAGSTIPSYVRPSMPIYHYEFLSQVTPEAFRASTLYPGSIGVPLMPALEALWKWLEKTRRRAQETAARKEVQDALQQLLVCRAHPAQPGC